MELSRHEYPALLGSLQPGQAVIALNERLKRIGKLNSEIADWLQERRRVEETYVQGLRKLARRQPPDEYSELGIFQIPWQKILSSTDSLAQSHHILAQKTEADIERPLREFIAKNREMQAIMTMQGNLAARAKEIETAQKKVDKLKDKGAKASAGKVAQATSEVESATATWDSQAPYIFEKLQAVDENRLNHLRDVLTQYQTHEVDQVERNRIVAEECLNVLLNIETADEIKTYAIRTAEGRPRIERQRSRTTPSSTLAPSTPAIVADDGASQGSGSVKEQRHGGLSSLKRLGTVIGRRRQSATPYGRPSSPDKRSTSNLETFARAGSSRDQSHISASPRGSSPHLPLPSTREEAEPPGAFDLPSSPRGLSSSHEKTNGNEDHQAMEDNLISGTGAPNGVSQHTGSIAIEAAPEEPSSLSKEEITDAEGFSVPPPSTDAISQAEQEAASENAAPQFKLDIRNDPIQEEDGDAESALANVANTLRAQAAPNRKAGTLRGRRDVRNTIFVPSPTSAEQSSNESPGLPQSPFRIGRTATLLSEDHANSDTLSVHSSRSMNSLASSAVKHPELHQPGLNSSLIETISAWFQHGQISKAVMIGELALAFNPIDLSAPFGTETLRLENFPILEKVAPNPTCITQVPDKAGEYTVNLASITRTTVAFKYQIHMHEGNFAAHIPIALTPIWKIESTQASVILNYSINPSFLPGEGRTVHMQNVMFVVHLEGAKATSCQSKPVGTFSREKSVIYWKLGELTLDQENPQKRLLARFATESEAKPGNVEARWEIGAGNNPELGSGLQLTQLNQTKESAGGEAESADPFADESAMPSPTITWKEVPTLRKLRSGVFTAI
ncbi:hypothetical protein L228DRAFT_280460 [Xylona heveae TC161]|uniref:MHD domain-containing protein n=1 Tax=Xylona heveae (strain CBS 132557 / TC161) TaxID=1328760 RepID=A0A165IPP9_XYLHT|nr:hypothetical protein L228DRAFT_280460 [Xylona heveae TC161]KZF25203.1 hypothetical protein L228DRAFT_280460 [Xylona heveae TC161]